MKIGQILKIIYMGFSLSNDSSPRKQKVGCSNPSRDRPKSSKQVVTAPLLNDQK